MRTNNYIFAYLVYTEVVNPNHFIKVLEIFRYDVTLLNWVKTFIVVEMNDYSSVIFRKSKSGFAVTSLSVDGQKPKIGIGRKLYKALVKYYK